VSPLSGGSSPPPVEPADPQTALLVALARLEAKVDLVIGEHTTKIADHENRIRTVEQKSTVSPLGLWTAVLGALGGAGVLVTLWNALTP